MYPGHDKSFVTFFVSRIDGFSDQFWSLFVKSGVLKTTGLHHYFWGFVSLCSYYSRFSLCWYIFPLSGNFILIDLAHLVCYKDFMSVISLKEYSTARCYYLVQLWPDVNFIQCCCLEDAFPLVVVMTTAAYVCMFECTHTRTDAYTL